MYTLQSIYLCIYMGLVPGLTLARCARSGKQNDRGSGGTQKQPSIILSCILGSQLAGWSKGTTLCLRQIKKQCGEGGGGGGAQPRSQSGKGRIHWGHVFACSLEALLLITLWRHFVAAGRAAAELSNVGSGRGSFGADWGGWGSCSKQQGQRVASGTTAFLDGQSC